MNKGLFEFGDQIRQLIGHAAVEFLGDAVGAGQGAVEFGDGRARYEDSLRDHHDHLIDVNSGKVIEFVDPEIEALQERIAARLGYRLIGHRLELLGVPVKKT